jgi:hypothetical protein
MQVITIETQKNRALILHCFPDGEWVRAWPRRHGQPAASVYVVYIDYPIDAAAELRPHSPYLAALIDAAEHEIGFILPAPAKTTQRFRKPEV